MCDQGVYFSVPERLGQGHFGKGLVAEVERLLFNWIDMEKYIFVICCVVTFIVIQVRGCI